MKNVTHLRRNLAFVVFLFVFALGAMAQPVPQRADRDLDPFEVLVKYYPDANFTNSTAVKLSWGTEMYDNFFDFESGDIPFNWDNDPNYPWVVTTLDTAEFPGAPDGKWLMSGNKGVHGSTSTLQVTLEFVASGVISFDAGCFGEIYGTTMWDSCSFFIDSVAQFSSALGTWDNYTYQVSQGMHTFVWSFTKDDSANGPGDAFVVDNISFSGLAIPDELPFVIDSTTRFNIYRDKCGGTAPNPVLIAENVAGNQYIDETWMNLEVGDYTYSVEIIGAEDAIYGTGCFYKPDVTYYTVLAEADPDEAGTVTGAGTYGEGAKCSLRATPNFGYYFNGWYLNDQEYTWDNPLVFMVDTLVGNSDSVQFVAKFGPSYFSADIYAEPGEGGTAEFGDDNDYYPVIGDTITLRAVPNTGYKFVNWTAHGFTQAKSTIVLSTDTVYPFIMDSDFLNEVFADDENENGEDEEGGSLAIQFIANFEKDSLDITALADPEFGGTVEGAGRYLYGDSCTLTATPNMGYIFANWILDQDSVVPTNPFAFTVEESTLYVAHFDTCHYYMYLLTPDFGSPVVNNETQNSDRFLTLGDSISLKARPYYGFELVQWEAFGYVEQFTGNEPGVVISTDSVHGFVVDAAFLNLVFDSTYSPNSESYGVVFRAVYAEYVPCEQPTELTATEVGSDYAILTWTDEGGATAWQIMLNDDEDNLIEVEELPFTLTGLTRNTEYTIQVRGNCDDSPWSDTLSFKTLNVIGGGDDINQYLPLSNYYKYSLTQQIYTKEELGEAGVIESIGFFKVTDYLCNRTINIYMVSTDKDRFESATDWIPVTSDHLVFSGTVNFITGDWTVINLDEPFVFDGLHNVVIVVDDNTGSYNDRTFFKSFSTQLSQALFQFNNSNNYDPTDSPGAGSAPASQKNQLYLEMSPLSDCMKPQYLAATEVGSDHVVLDWNEYGASESWTVVVRNLTPSPAPIADITVDVTEHPCTITDLDPGTDYAVRVRPTCDTLWSKEITFTTEAIFEIAVSANPTVGGTVTGGAEYNEGDTCTVTATPNEGYLFVEWTENGTQVSTSASYGFTVEGARTLVANFQLIKYYPSVTYVPENYGYAWVDSNNSQVIQYGEEVVLKAMPYYGYHLVNWTTVDPVTDSIIELSTDTVFSFTMDANHILTSLYPVGGDIEFIANFDIDSYEVTATANPEEGGTIVNNNSPYEYYTPCSLTARANEGYHFVNWTEDGVGITVDTTYSFTVVEARNLVANFELNSYTITADVNPDEGGTVTGNNGTYNHFDTCQLTATPNEGYHFVNWTENGEEVATDSIYSFEVTGAHALVANFEKNSYEIAVELDLAEGGEVGGAGNYLHGDPCELTAYAMEGYTFDGWSEDGEIISTDSVYSFTVTGPRNLVALFSLNSYEITAEALPEEGGTINGNNGTYNHFDVCELTATPNEGYHFVEWTEDGEQVATDSVYSFEVTGARDLVAHFFLNMYEIAATAEPEEGGTVEGAGTYEHFNLCELIATPEEGYRFAGWSEDGEIISTDSVYSFTVEGPRTLVANFTLNQFVISVKASPSNGGTVSGGGAYTYGASCTLKANPATGFNFTRWTKNGAQVSTDANYTFTVTEDALYTAQFTKKNFTIAASVNPEDGGTITGTGTYTYQTTATLIAKPNEGYTFLNWTENGEVVSTNATYSFPVTGERTLVAHFEWSTFEITAEVNPTEGGSIACEGMVDGVGTFDYGVTCELTATANDGYSFEGWSVNGETVTTEETYSFTVTEAVALVANFSLDIYAVTAEANPVEGGTITGEGFSDGEGDYAYGTTCSLTATANEGYTFESWSVDGETVSTDETYTFTVELPTQLVANFSLNTYEVTATANPAEGGTIAGEGFADGTGTYEHGATCELTAIANDGYSFTGWSINGETITNEDTYSFTVTEAVAVVANFTLDTYEITIAANPAEGGTVSGEGFTDGVGAFDYGMTCSVTATANEGYTFEGWSVDGETVTTETTYSFTVDRPTELVANFSLNTYEVTVTVNPTEGGTITGEGLTNGVGTFDHGATCTLTATANEGYTFEGWSENGELVTTDETLSFTVTGDRTLVANFLLNSYEITAMANPTEGGTITGEGFVNGVGTYDHGATCSLTATANEGYTFEGWSINGETITYENTYSFTVTEAVALVATFTLDTYAVTAEADPAEGGTITGEGFVNGEGDYDYGTTCSLTATANEGYTFVNWTKDGAVVSTNATYTFTVEAPAYLVAHFTLNTYEITATANPAEGGTITGANTYDYGASCTLTATAATGYTFVNWTKGGVQVATTPSYTFAVTESGAYVANFSLNSYAITATADPADGGTITGAGTFNYGATCELTATNKAGYTFVNWTKNGSVVSSNATYSFTVTEAAAFVAHFSLDSYEITATANPSNGGIVGGAGTFNYGASCTLTATAATGYTFVNWTKNGTEMSTDPSYTFTVTEAGAYTANFTLNTYVITATADPAEGGTITGAGTYNQYFNCTLTATANPGYSFEKWTENGTTVSTVASYSFQVSSDRTLVAHFTQVSYQITALVDPEGTGDIEGAGFYHYGETCTLTVTPHAEYELINWTLDGVEVSQEETITFVVTGSAIYTAHLDYDGVGEQSGIAVSLFPNPATDKLNIEVSEPVNMVEIYTIQGALVSKLRDASDKIEINLEDYAFGTYLVRITTDNKVVIKKFVKE